MTAGTYANVKTLSLLTLVLLIMLAILLSIFVWILVDEDPQVAMAAFGASDKSRILEFLGVSMGGVLLAIQATISHKRAKAMEDAVKEQAQANLHTERGQRQERLKNAIEHLGHASRSVRLGGSYELFHLARDSDDLRRTVLDILCAHIRRTTSRAKYRLAHQNQPSEEIQSLLSLLLVGEHDVFEGLTVDLRGSWLSGVTLKNARLEKAILNSAYLQGAKFQCADLRGSELDDCCLQQSNLVGAKLQDARLLFANLEGAHLTAMMQGASFHGAKLYGAMLGQACLQGADLRGAHLQGAELTAAHLEGADLRGAKLQAAFLGNAHFQEAKMEGCCLHGVISRKREDLKQYHAHIRERWGKESDLSSVIFEGGLTQSDVDLAFAEWSPESGTSLQQRLRRHVNKAISNETPKGSGAIVGVYTQEEAEQWTSDYNEGILMGKSSE